MTDSPIIREEFAASILGVPGRIFAATVGGKGYRPGTFTSQKATVSRPHPDDPKNLTVRAQLRFDDNCRNGHNSFAITGEVIDRRERRDGGIVACGCIHEDIAKAFPELASLIPWHLTSADGPLHYIANTVYHAGDRDYRGKRAGEPWAWDKAIQFGANPIKHKVKAKFWQFLKDAAAHPGRDRFDFEVIEISERKESPGGKVEYYRKWTFGGYGVTWYDCPFDTEDQAFDFLKALQTCGPVFLEVPTLFSEGKARDLDAARAAAVWPEATDAELMQEPEALKAALMARHADLTARFRAAMESVGFMWAPPVND